jgi:hypothetical protein
MHTETAPLETRFWHASFNSIGNVVLFPDEATVRRAVRCLARAISGQLVGFCLADTHCHFHTAHGREHAGSLLRAIQRSVGAVAAARLRPTHFEPVRDQRHNLNTIRYLLRQPAHHDIPVHPALWSGSVFLDLVGARYVRGLMPQLGPWMPRLHLRELMETVGLPGHRMRRCRRLRFAGSVLLVWPRRRRRRRALTRG